jgi:hypothetical protein
MGQAVDIHQEVGALPGGRGAEAPIGESESPLVLAETLHVQLDRCVVDRHPVALGAELVHPEAVGLAAVAQVHPASHLAACLGPSAPREGVEARSVGGRGLVVELDGRL